MRPTVLMGWPNSVLAASINGPRTAGGRCYNTPVGWREGNGVGFRLDTTGKMPELSPTRPVTFTRRERSGRRKAHAAVTGTPPRRAESAAAGLPPSAGSYIILAMLRSRCAHCGSLQTPEFGIQIRQRFLHQILVSRVLARFQFPKDPGARKT